MKFKILMKLFTQIEGGLFCKVCQQDLKGDS